MHCAKYGIMSRKWTLKKRIRSKINEKIKERRQDVKDIHKEFF